MSDKTVIQGGHVIDGTGIPGRETNIAVVDGLIVEVGPNIAVSEATVIDARKQVVAPGFIDIKTHSDWTLPIMPKAESKISQGVTTEVIGHCGYSCAPVLPGKSNELADYLSPSAPWIKFKTTTFTDYLAQYRALSVNTIHLVGHNTLRLMAMGMEDRTPTQKELDHMASMLVEALDAGALGMSSGLFTAPGSYSETEEMVTLGKILAKRGARYFTHLRDEGNSVFDSIQETMEFANQVGTHVQIVHVKLSGIDNWGNADKLLDLLADARNNGIPVDCDFYPYTAASNPLKNLFPPWLQEGGVERMIHQLGDNSIRERLRLEIKQSGLNNFGQIPDWDAVRISISPDAPQFEGRTISDIAKERGKEDFDVALDYIIEDRGQTRVLVNSIAEEDIIKFIKSSDIMIGSDGNSVSPEGITGKGRPHPRFYGTFPRVLGKYCRDEGHLLLHEAIFKMTGASAKALGLRNRGLIKPGYAADLTIFDPSTISDCSTYENPHQFCTGIAHVIVNGKTAFLDGEHTGTLAGKILSRQKDFIP
tara:strand:- start:111 stop:1715 length:1605 start_codon:yes stop_codon:yes gene_type:complete